MDGTQAPPTNSEAEIRPAIASQAGTLAVKGCAPDDAAREAIIAAFATGLHARKEATTCAA